MLLLVTSVATQPGQQKQECHACRSRFLCHGEKAGLLSAAWLQRASPKPFYSSLQRIGTMQASSPQ